MKVFWFIPTHGDGRYLGTAESGRVLDFDYLRQVTALVGSAETVAARMGEYHALGVENFIFSGYPHLEEAYRLAELLFPRLPLCHAVRPRAETPLLKGEIMANDAVPVARAFA